MKKLFLIISSLLFVFFCNDLNAQVEITSATITTPIICNGGLADVDIIVDNDSGGTIPPIQYQLKFFKVDPFVTFSYISTNQYASNNVTVTGVDSSFYYLLVVDSAAFATAYNPFTQFFANSFFTNTVLNDPSVYDFDTLSIGAPDAIIASSAEISANACYGDNIAQEQLIISGGTLPYFVDGNIISGTDTIFSNLSAGTYTYTIDDGNSCSTTASFTIDEPNELIPGGSVSSDYNGQDISCFGASDGEITAASTGGSGTIEYSIDGINYSSNPCFSGLSAGTYTIYYKDVNDCISNEDFTLTEPTNLNGTLVGDSSVTCFQSCDAQINMTSVSGGTPTYLYSIDGGLITNNPSASGLCGNQFHEITVIDANGCSFSDSIFVSEPDLLTFSGDVSSDLVYNGFGVSCYGSSDGEITFQIF